MLIIAADGLNTPSAAVCRIFALFFTMNLTISLNLALSVLAPIRAQRSRRFIFGTIIAL